MKAILATVMLRDDEGRQLGRFTETINVPDEGYVEAARDAIATASGFAIEEFARNHLVVVEKEFADLPAEALRMETARTLTAELDPVWQEYIKERAVIERKYGNVRQKLTEIKTTIAELSERNRKRVLKD